MSETEKKIIQDIQQVIDDMRAAKPGDRTEKDRHYAIAITQAEITLAVFRDLAAGGNHA